MVAHEVAALEDRYEALCLAQIKAVMLKRPEEVERLRVEILFVVTALGVEMSRPCREYVRGEV